MRYLIKSANPVFESRLRIPASSPGSLFFWIPRSIPASSPGSLLFWIPRSIRLLVWSQILEISRLYFYLYLVENLEKNLWLIGLNVTKYKQIFLLLMKRAHCIRLPRVHSVRERDEKRAKKRNFHRGRRWKSARKKKRRKLSGGCLREFAYAHIPRKIRQNFLYLPKLMPNIPGSYFL